MSKKTENTMSHNKFTASILAAVALLIAACSDYNNVPANPIDDRFLDTATVVVDTTGAISCARAVQLGDSAGNVKVIGYATSAGEVSSTKQQTVWMADAIDGGNVFEAYLCNIYRKDTIHNGDLVMVTGTVTVYNTTTEIKNGNFYIIRRAPKTYTYYTESLAGSLGDFTVNTLEGAAWEAKATYAQVSGAQTHTQLISPTIDLSETTDPVLKFGHCHMNSTDPQTQMKLYVRTADSDWQNLEIPEYAAGTTPPVFVESGAISLKAYAGRTDLQIMFDFNTTSVSGTPAPTWRVKNINITETK